MTAAIEHAEKGLAQRGSPNGEPDQRRSAGTDRLPVTTDDGIGHQLPPIPRAARPLVAGGRKRLRSIKRSLPAAGTGVVVAISLAILATVAVLIVARSRRRSPAQELMARLERVPERINALDI